MQTRGRTVFVVVLVVLALLVAVAATVVLMARGGRPASGRHVVELDLTRALADHVPQDTLARALMDGRPSLREVLGALDRAAADERVVALVARVGPAPMGLATIQELRHAVTRFGESGKKAVAFAETFGEWTPGNGSYYLASAFGDIYLQPSGDVNLSGLKYEVPFVAGTLEKLGLEPQLDRRHEYKNAVDTYTESAMTAAHEEAMQALADSQFSQIVTGIAAARDQDEREVRELFDRGPFLAAEALENGLVDGLLYSDELRQSMRDELGEDIRFVDLLDSSGHALSRFGPGPKVALIQGVGAVVRGESRYDPWSGLLMGSDTVARGFREAIEDPEVRAILFRVDSPGGSYVASDTIWRETVRAREAGKPVVVSMGEVAASGGYFVSMSANRIVAQPGTITGSIGVYGGKMVSQLLWQKLGVTFDSVSTSANSGMWSPLEEYSEYGWERLQDALDRIYDDFVGKVASGRGLERTEVEAVARGRIWSGEKALEIGLVDALGGYRRAEEEIKALLGLGADAPIRLRTFPRPRSAWELLAERLPRTGTEGASRELAAAALRELHRLQPVLWRLGVGTAPLGPLSAPRPEPPR